MILTKNNNQPSSYIHESNDQHLRFTNLVPTKADIYTNKPKSRRRSLEAVAAQAIIKDLGPYDILNGRCATSFNNIGNRRFRVTIGINLQRYMDAPTRQAKGKVIKSVVQVLKNDVGARFLKNAADGNGYVELSDKKFREKVGHALRDMAVQLEGPPTSTPSSTKTTIKQKKVVIKKKHTTVQPIDVFSSMQEDEILKKEKSHHEEGNGNDNVENVWNRFTRSYSIIQTQDDDIVLFSALSMDWD